MNDLISTVDWSRAQFALTAMYHWLFVPLTIGLSLILAIMETVYVKTRDERWKKATRFWMTIFGINFACGVATGIILEFQFGTNWSNYSWFVGDIFGAPLAIEGLFAFFLEATFVAVMFFGWNRVSAKFHLASTWLTAIGVCLSALWILIANSWMQLPTGMEFNPDEMRNEMSDFWAVVSSPVAMNKFFHAVFSGWALAGAFVVGISCWMIWRKRSEDAAMMSLKVGTWAGLIGMVLTMWTGDGSAVQVAKHQPMKLAAMEGLYNGSAALVRESNEYIADVVKRHPDRYGAFAMLPWSAPEEAAKEAERVQSMGFQGIMLAGGMSGDGEFLDDVHYLPILEACEALALPIYVHPAPPLETVRKPYYGGLDNEVSARLSLHGWGWHNEAGIQVLRVLLAGRFDQFPKLQLIAGHWGEMVPFFLSRLDQSMPQVVTKLQRTITETFRQNIYVTPSGIFDRPVP